MNPRLLATLVLCALGASAATPAVSHAARSPRFETRQLVLAGVPGPNPPAPDSRHCTGAGGACRLAATLYLPTPVPEGGAPAVLMQHGWAGDRNVDYVREAAELFASRGYVVLTWDARGWGASQGYVMLDSPDHEGKDVSRLIDYLAGRPEVRLDAGGDPRVGMYGQSYGGAIQLIAAALDRRIDAVAARETWHDLAHALAPGGVLKHQWIGLLFAAGESLTQAHLAPELKRWLTEALATNRLPAEVAAELRKRSPAAYAGRIRVPTFLAQGERDTLFNLIESSRNAALVSGSGAPVKLFWYWGGHGGYPVYPDAPKRWTPDDLLEARQLAWMDRYLKGDADAAVGPRFEYFDASGRLRSAGRLPPLATSVASFGRGGETLAKPPARACPPYGAPHCSYTELSNFSAPGQPGDRPPYDPPGTFVALDVDPLARPVAVAGNPTATFSIDTASGRPVSLFLKVFDVSPSGEARLINRLVTPVKAEPGEPLSVDMAGFAHTFAKGHRIRLVIASTDAAYLPTDEPDRVTLRTPVRVELPVLDAAAIDAGGGAEVLGDRHAPKTLPATGTGRAAGQTAGLLALFAASGILALRRVARARCLARARG